MTTQSLTLAEIKAIEKQLAEGEAAIMPPEFFTMHQHDIRRLLAAARREAEARTALALLLEAKREKDTNGKTRRYEFLRLEGWKRTEEVCATMFPSVMPEEAE